MPAPLKIVILGGNNAEVADLMAELAYDLGEVPVEVGAIAGGEIHRFAANYPAEGEAVTAINCYGVASGLDFRGVYPALLKGAHGAIGLIPANLSRIEASRRILGPLHQSLLDQKDQGTELALVLQYHWPQDGSAPSPEELDQALGVNPKAIERVFTQSDGSEQSKGLKKILSLLSPSADSQSAPTSS